MKHEGLTPGARALGVELSEQQAAQLEAFEKLLAELAVGVGMIAAGDLPRLRRRHVLDSLRAALTPTDSDRDAVDLGSGAGLPGMVVAVARPQLFVTLVESQRTRAGFLELAAERLGLTNVRVLRGRVEDLSLRTDLCFARAFADPRRSWVAAERLLRPGGRLVYFAGEAFEPGKDLPEGVSAVILPPPPVASGGPLVIMSRP